MKSKYDQLLQSEDDRIQKLHQMVLDAVNEEKLISQKIYEFEGNLSLSNKIADRVASFGGSWKSILVFFLVMLIWIFLNVFILNDVAFDPYPFILLNLVLSCTAALQAPVIMMSQNRKEQKDRKRAENDYLVNLKSEIEIRNLHQKIDLLIVEQMKSLFETQKIQLEMLEEIKEQTKLSEIS